MLGTNPILLLDSLICRVGGSPYESEACIVSFDWVASIATLSPKSSPQLAREWLEAVAEESGEDVETESPYAVAAVSSLIELCRDAVARNTSVIFAWYL